MIQQKGTIISEVIPFLNQRWYRGGKEETTLPTKIALWF